MRSLCSTIVSIFVFDIFLIFFSSIKNKGICTFGAQLIAFKKSMKFTRLIVYLSLKSHKIVRTSTNFIDSLGAIFLSPKCANAPISYITDSTDVH